MPQNSKNKNIFDEIKLLEDYLINLNENKIIIFIKKVMIIYLGNWTIKNVQEKLGVALFVKLLTIMKLL